MAQSDCFIKIDGIDGESQDKTHKNEIDILSWSWGASQSGTTHMGSGSGGGKAHFQDMNLVMYIGKEFTALLNHLSTGKHISKATLCCRKAAGDNPLEYLKIEMKDLIISSLTTGGSGAEDRVTYNCSINFGEYKVMYTEQKPDGSKGATPEFAWDIAANEKK